MIKHLNKNSKRTQGFIDEIYYLTFTEKRKNISIEVMSKRDLYQCYSNRMVPALLYFEKFKTKRKAMNKCRKMKSNTSAMVKSYIKKHNPEMLNLCFAILDS